MACWELESQLRCSTCSLAHKARAIGQPGMPGMLSAPARNTGEPAAACRRHAVMPRHGSRRDECPSD